MRRSRACRTGILCHDPDGGDHLLVVTNQPAGFISIEDDQNQRILTPSATVGLVMALLAALGSHVPARRS